MILIKGKPLKKEGKLEGKINPDEPSGQELVIPKEGLASDRPCCELVHLYLCFCLFPVCFVFVHAHLKSDNAFQ